jgi:glycosyltransferase involved in cell wall biosynthesis
MRDRGFVVLQIPEVCTWNSYVDLAEQSLRARGVRVVRPGLCVDGPFKRPRQPPRIDPTPDVVHVHWPEMLAAWYGIGGALRVLRSLVEAGAHLIQTVHDLRPHESSPELVTYLHEVDALTTAAHYFSPEHERQARVTRPNLPDLSTHLPHPAFPTVGPATGDWSAPHTAGPATEIVLGCLGRIRPYKRFTEFARIFGHVARPGFRLLVAGAPHSNAIDQDMRMLARDYPQISYQPGFTSAEGFSGLLGEVDWVALPYRQVYSSGVLVAALGAGRPVLMPRPTGAAERMAVGSQVVDPWDDATAVHTWMAAASRPRPPVPRQIFPTWDAAAHHLIRFFEHVLAQVPTP